MKAVCILFACAALVSGCVVTRRVDDGGRSGGDRGVTVEVRRDGSLSYRGRNVTREKLVRELREDAFVEVDGRPAQRVVVLEAGDGVTEERLAGIRDYLVANRIPRVVLRTAREFETDVRSAEDDGREAARRAFNRRLWADIEAERAASAGESTGRP